MNKANNEERLAKYFHRNGCRRKPDENRMEESSKSYKKGWEIRMVANDEAEAAEITELLKSLGFKPGKPYAKQSQIILPVYGREASEKFSELLGRVAKL